MLEFAKTPPKGWNSWDVYGASVTEEEVKRNADIMAEKLKKYGWNYVVVDIQWYEPGAESAAYRVCFRLKIVFQVQQMELGLHHLLNMYTN